MRFFTFLLCVFSVNLLAQPWYDAKRNYQWITGYQWDSTVYDPDIENVIYDFTGDTMRLIYETKNPSSETNFTNGSICDKNGNLLLFSTGCRVHEADGTIIPGTDSMNAGYIYDSQCHDYKGNLNSGYIVPQGLMFLPVGEFSFYLFYLWADSRDNFGYACFKLYSMKINKEPGDDHFKASGINRIALEDTLNGGLAACRHANGRDWWLICPKSKSNRIFTFLVDSSGIKLFEQDIGAKRIHPWDDWTGQCAFSPDGTRFIEYCIQSDLKIFDFDRCTGRLSNPLHIPIEDEADFIYAAGACVSPNGRYLYTPSSRQIYQFDLLSSDIPASKQTVAVYDGIQEGFLNLSFANAELAPDGKIYIANLTGRTTYHVIEYPDLSGTACVVKQHAQWTKWGVASIPHHPSYLLGPLAGSGCDTLTSATQARRKNGIKIFPNPVSDNALTIEIAKDESGYSEACEIKILDQLGRVVEKRYVPPYTPLQKIDTGAWKTGVYFVHLVNIKNQLLAVEKVVKI